MQRRGTLRKQFDRYEDGVYYYVITTTIDGETVEVTLPRYHPYLGWVEAFGIPPQPELLTLAEVAAFTKESIVSVSGTEYQETFTYTPQPENQAHQIEIVRQGAVTEKTVFTEQYAAAPAVIDITSTVSDGTHTATTNLQKGMVSQSALSDPERVYVTDVCNEHGETDTLWRKTFTVTGESPLVQTSLFPVIPELANGVYTGSSIEVGYLAGGTGLAAIHGRWYKRIEVNKQVFYIHESGFATRHIETESGPTEIIDQYQKELFSE